MGKSVTDSSARPEGIARPRLLAPHSVEQSHNVLDALDKPLASSGKVSRVRRSILLSIPLLALASWAASLLLSASPPSALDAENAIAASAEKVSASPAEKPPVASDTWTEARATANATAPDSYSSPFPVHPSERARPIATPPTGLTEPRPTNPSNRPLRGAERSPKSISNPPKLRSTEPTSLAKSEHKAPAPPQNTVTKSSLTKSVLAKAATPVDAKSANSDPDVELLGAIMKHMGDAGRTSAKASSSPETIAALVKSCKEQDPIQALVCQRHICEGSWGKAQACPAHLAPKSHTKQPAS